MKIRLTTLITVTYIPYKVPIDNGQVVLRVCHVAEFDGSVAKGTADHLKLGRKVVHILRVSTAEWHTIGVQ